MNGFGKSRLGLVGGIRKVLNYAVTLPPLPPAPSTSLRILLKTKRKIPSDQDAVPFGSPNTTYLLNFNKLGLCQSIPSTTINRTFSTNMAQQSTNGSLCRQNYHEECEAHVNKQINMELYASYVYLSMAYYFDREDVALPGFHKYFKKNSDEEREHAEKLMRYQNKRGGRIVLQPIAKPTRDEWSGPLEAITAALELEKTVNQTLLDLHAVSGRNGDPHLADFLETEYLEEQVKSIKELAGHITNLNRAGKGLGEFLYDKELNE